MQYIGKNYASQNKINLSLTNYQEGLSIYKEIGDTSGWAEILYEIGLFNLKQGKEDTASHIFNKSINLLKEINNWQTLQNLYNDTGNWYKGQGQIPKAIDFFDQSFEIAFSVKDSIGMAFAYEKIAGAYESQQEFSEALSYINKSLHLYQKMNHLPGIARANNFAGNLAIKQNNFDLAFEKSYSSLRQSQSLHDSCKFSPALINIGRSFLAKNKIDSAFYYLSWAKRQANDCIDNEVSAKAHLWLGQVYKSKKRNNESLQNLEKALSLAQKSQNKSIIMEISAALYPVYHKQGKLQKAFELQSLYYTNKEAVLNASNTYKLSLRDREKEDAERALIQQKKDSIRQGQLSKHRMITYIALLSLLILLIIFFSYFRNFKIKKKANILLSEQNDQISKQKAELEKLDATKSRLFANISHELRTPLTLISSPVQQILINKKNNLDTEEIDQLKMVVRNTKQLKGLVNDIMDLSKLESNRLELVEWNLALLPYLRRVVGNFDSLAQHLKINYALETNLLEDAFTLIDSDKTEKIINNLISNAIKHTPAGGSVTVLAERIEDQLQIQVTDTGSGIPEEDLPHIFDRFFQSNNANASLQGGTGIGLALAKELTQLMTGELKVHSEFGKGSTFTLILPYKTATAPHTTDSMLIEEEKLSPIIPITTGTKSHTILIVEDHPDMQRFVQQLLSPNHTTLVANNGLQALDILEKESVDLIISDVMMPEMDGFTLLQKVKDHPLHHQIPIIMLTALNTEEKKLEALTLGVDDYLGKPFSPEELLARVNNLLQRYEIRQQVALEIQEELVQQKDEVSIPPKEFSEEKDIRDKDADWLQQIEKILHDELENSEFSLTKLAEQFFLSERQFRRKMTKLTGMSPKKFQQEVALQEARKLLEQQAYGSVKAIAYSIGMSNNIWRFSKLYEARFGKKPSEYF